MITAQEIVGDTKKMANIIFDFLTESFLFSDSGLSTAFSGYSDVELLQELKKYYDYIGEHKEDIIVEFSNDKFTNVCIESAEICPSFELLKQIAMYVDCVIVQDPLYEYIENIEKSEVANVLININQEKISRDSLAKKIKYMKDCTPMVASRYIKFYPLSFIKDGGKIPIFYDDNNFRNMIPDDIYNFFYSNVDVRNVVLENGTARVYLERPLEIGDCIAVRFGNDTAERPGVFTYKGITHIPEKDTEKGLCVRIDTPQKIDEREFRYWVENTINRSAINRLIYLNEEIDKSNKLGCTLLTTSDFNRQLLDVTTKQNSLRDELLKLSLNLSLPVFENASIIELMNIRDNYAESCKNFRVALNKRLLSVRSLTDEQAIQKAIEDIRYEFTEVQVHDIEKEHRKILKSFGIDAMLLSASLISSFFVGNLSFPSAALSAAKLAGDYKKYSNDIVENNAYLFWKLSRN